MAATLGSLTRFQHALEAIETLDIGEAGPVGHEDRVASIKNGGNGGGFGGSDGFAEGKAHRAEDCVAGGEAVVVARATDAATGEFDGEAGVLGISVADAVQGAEAAGTAGGDFCDAEAPGKGGGEEARERAPERWRRIREGGREGGC